MNDLILRITGKVKQSNFPEFKAETMAMIKSADKPLVSDSDFAEAERTVKDFKAAEDAIKRAKDESLKEVADINKLFESLDEVAGALRTTRLSLNKKVTKEKAERKQQVVDAGCEKLEKAIDIVAETVPEIHGAIAVRRNLFEDAVSGKRKIESMEEAVDALLDFENERLVELQVLILDNKRRVEDSGYPSLFPDAAHVVCRPSSEVQALVEGRVAKHQLAEKERKEKAEAAAKAEEERKVAEAAEAAGKKATNELEVKAAPVQTIHEPIASKKADTSTPQPKMSQEKEHESCFVITVNLTCTSIKAREIASMVNGLICDNSAVTTIRLSVG